ncbi:MAG: hypothetical protein K6E30_05800 [Lachnospiraceae bacterium]|nr:hypothetical protein [Lachnospiraceae bacterium]
MAKTYTYDEYLEMSDALPFEEADKIYRMLLDNANTEDEDFLALWEDFMKVAVTYANVRGNWKLFPRGQRKHSDEERTACHDAVISHLNGLTRYMEMLGWDTAWRDELGRDERLHRKRLGDFACFAAYVYSVIAR